uniref:N-acetyltransferase domain-containing protein n=1 Tax=Plectus sambesii TaxID=2011161 RepID=A0A914XQ94_9BILA
MRENATTQLVGDKLILIPYLAEHVPKYHGWMQDEQLRAQTASEPLTLEEEYDMQRSWAEDADKCTFIILSRERLLAGASSVNAMVGDVNLFFTDTCDRSSAELEIMIAESTEQRKGLGLAASAMMMLYAVEKLGVRTFTAKIGSKNEKSLRMFKEKLAFEQISFSEVFDEVTLELIVNDSAIERLQLCAPNMIIEVFEANRR